jgi:cell shape-determining protein MreC
MTLTFDMLVLLEGLGLLIGGVWFVAKITASVNQLTNSLARLERIVERLDERLANHETRLIHMEAKE